MYKPKTRAEIIAEVRAISVAEANMLDGWAETQDTIYQYRLRQDVQTERCRAQVKE